MKSRRRISPRSNLAPKPQPTFEIVDGMVVVKKTEA